jgi:curved DNA-binding protein CbpA
MAKCFLTYLRCVLQLKDYYSILELQPSATGEEIKKAYRRLAHLYHPDKKNNDRYAAAKFAEIKEAYDTLINPVKKNQYLQRRWYAKSMGRKFDDEIVTPVTVLKRMLELNRYASRQDAHRMYHEGLYNQLVAILSDENIETLNAFREPGINKQVVLLALKVSHSLPYKFVLPLDARLKKLFTADEQLTKRIDQFTRHHRQVHFWEKKKIWIVLLIVLLICLSIFLSVN